MPLRLAAVVLVLLAGGMPAAAQPLGEPQRLIELKGKPAAPEFTGIQAWINSKPLKMSDLKGKVVLVHLFAYS